MQPNFNVRCRVKGTNLYFEPIQRRAQTTTVGTGSSYDAASGASRFSKWLTANGGPNTTLNGSLSTLRARSRDARRKFVLADRAIESLVSDIIGTGIVPRFRTENAEFNRQLADDWAAWVNQADADGVNSLYGLQALAVGAMCEGGDTFVRLRPRRATDNLIVPLQLQVLESEFCPDHMTEPRGRNQIRAGVEFNGIGRRVAYHLYRQHPHDYEIQGFITESLPVRVPAVNVIHMAQRRRPGLIRGEPLLTRILVALRDFDLYDDAQRVRQQIAAMFAGYVRQDAEEGDEGVIFGEGTPDTDGVSLAPLEPGTMQKLLPGEEVQFSNPPSPGDDYEAYMRQQQRNIAVGANILYESLTGDYSQVNDRTWRAAVNQFRRYCTMWQHHIVIFQLCRPTMERWAQLYVMSGRPIPEGITADDIAAVKWIPQGWAYINPLQDVQAKKVEVRSGFKSRGEVIAEQGGDIEVTDAQIRDDNARSDHLELVFDSDPRKTAASGSGQTATDVDAPDSGDGGNANVT